MIKHMHGFFAKAILIAGILSAGVAQAQNPTCPTRPNGDNSNACASTAFVQNAVTGTLTIPGTGGQTRTILSMFLEYPTSTDWSNATNAYNYVNSTGGGTIFIPGGITAPTLPSTYNNAMWDYLGPAINFPDAGTIAGVGQVQARRLFKAKPTGPHSNGISRWIFGIDSQAIGSGTNGPGDTDGGLFISAAKENWSVTTNFGEMDGISVLVRNGGPNGTLNSASSSDASAYAADVGIKLNSGFAVVMEAGTKIFNTDGTIARSSSFQIAGISSTPGHSASTGLVLGPIVGSMDDGILLAGTTAAPMVNVLRYSNSAGDRFKLDSVSQIFIYPNDGTSTGFVKIYNGDPAGNVTFLNTGGVPYFLSDATTGNTSTLGTMSGSSFLGQSVQLLGTTSGSLTVKTAAIAGSNTLTFPAGTTNFTSTGGTSQVIKQTTSGGAFTVARLACADLSDSAGGCSAAGGITALTGDVTASGSGSVAATLATVNANVGSFGSSTAIPNFTVNGKGLITAAGTNVVIAPAGTLTGATLAANVLATSITSVGTLTGGATGAGFTIALTTSTVSGTLPCANTPAYTGDVTKSSTSCTTVLATAQPAVHTWALAQTFTVAPVFTDASGSRTALGLGTMATQAASAVAITGGTITGLTGLAIRDTSAAFDVTIAATSSGVLSAGRTLTLNMGNVAHTLAFGTTANTITFPNAASDTVAMLAVANVFTGAMTINSTGGNLTLGGNTTPQIQFQPSSGSTKTAQYFQAGDVWALAAAGVGNKLTIDLGTGQVATIVNVASTSKTTGTIINAGGFGNAGAIFTDTLSVITMASDSAQTDNTVCINSSGLLLKGTGTLGICLGTSSLRYKQDVQPMKDGLAQIAMLKPKNFFYKKGHGDDGVREQYGFIAEDVVEVLPKLVALDSEEQPNSIDGLGLTFVAIHAIQELKAANDNLQQQIQELRNRK